jgi:hypothetical protein
MEKTLPDYLRCLGFKTVSLQDAGGQAGNHSPFCLVTQATHGCDPGDDC